jgi:hypothetical protein
MASSRLLFASVGVALIGCGTTEPRGCDLCTTSAIIYGTVQTVTGERVASVLIDAEVHRDSCAGWNYAISRRRRRRDAAT